MESVTSVSTPPPMSVPPDTSINGANADNGSSPGTTGIHTVNGASRTEEAASITGINNWDHQITWGDKVTTLRDEFNKQLIMAGIQQMQPLIEKMKEALRESEG